MKYCLLAVLLALGAPLHADLISLVATVEPQPAKRGGNVALKLQFTVDNGFHAYHKDNPGYSKPLKIEITDLAGLAQVGDAAWPKYHEHRDEKDPSWVEFELSGVFEIVYTFRVPAHAGEKLALSGKFEAQVCDVNACQDREGTFNVEVKVDGSAPAEETKQPSSSEDTSALKKELAETRKALEDKVGGLSEEVAALKKELTNSRKATEELAKSLKDYLNSQHEKAAASGTKDEHGFYEDYDFALAEAKKQGKLLLIDFNGEYWGACRKMERDVFTLPKVKELFARFVIVGLKTDIKNKRINELYAKYKDPEDPTIPLYVVLDHEEKSLGFIHATLGPEPKGDEDNGPPPSAFVKFLETMSAKGVTGDKPVDPTPKPTPKAEMKQGAETADAAKAFNTDEFLWFLLEAFGVGLITLLTPCVLPVLPLTIGFFVKQAEQKRPALITAGIYCGVILVSFTSIGVLASVLLGASGAGDIARSWWLNLGLGLLFIVLALSFLGMFELRMPSFLTMKTSQAQFQANKAGKGYVAAMISGTSFTLISFSCTGPFAAYVLARAASGDVILPAVGMLAYASGMALPIFIMGQFPSLMKSLPKSGSWMNAIKVVFGLMELALAFAYLGFAEFALRNGPPEIFSRNLVVAIWVACAAAAGLYLLGTYRLPHDHEKVEQIGVVRAIFAIMFLCLGAFMLPMLFGAPLGNLGAVIPPGPKDAPSAFGAKGGGESSDKLKPPVKTMELAKQEAKKTQRPIFVDFTGPAWKDCLWVEENILHKPVVSRVLNEKFIYTEMWVESGSEGEAVLIALKFSRALPQYAVLDAEGNLIARYDRPNNVASITPEGFASYLEDSLKKAAP